MLPVPQIPAADWPTVGQRFAASRRAAGVSVADAAAAIRATEDDVRAFEAGQPTLGVFDLRVLAERWGTTTGAWFCQDQPPLYRSSAGASADEAAEIGQKLMARYLAEEALAE